jgi:threonine aldolase
MGHCEGAPIGSCLVGPKAFIDKARRFRKLFGGGMRQTGFLAAYAAYALTHNFPLLPGVHALTKRLEKGLEEIGVAITSRAETCMVSTCLCPLTESNSFHCQIFYDPSPLGLDCEEIAERASELPDPITLHGSRLVVHIQTSEDAIDDFLALVRTLAEEKKSGGVLRERKPQVNKNPYAKR